MFVVEGDEREPLNGLLLTLIKGWDLFCCLEANFGDHGYIREDVQGFIVDASSSFYAEFGDLVMQRVDAWVDRRREERGLNELEADDVGEDE